MIARQGEAFNQQCDELSSVSICECVLELDVSNDESSEKRTEFGNDKRE